MELTVYTQYYRCKTTDRQLEIDECLRRNLNHPGIRKLVLFKESDAPPLPQATVELEVVESDERITYAEWLRWVQRQGSGIALLLNADIYLDEGLEHLAATFDSPEAFLALTRYNPGHAGFHLNDFPHWTQDVWGVRADAELPESLLYASSFPLGFPGCDNRIAYVMWSHGFRVRNPCYHVRSVHLQASTARHYDKTSDRLYGGVSYVHPSLAPAEDAELEFTLWTRSEQRPTGVLVNQQAIEQGVHQLRHGEAEVGQRFLDQQQFTGLSWVNEAVGSAHLEGDLYPFASEDTVFLPMPALLGDGVSLQLRQPARLEGLSLRLPRRAPEGYAVELQAEGDGETRLVIEGDTAVELKAGGERRFWQPAELKAHSWRRLRLKLVGAAVDPAWRPEEGAELVLFGEEGSLSQAKSLNVIAEDTPPSHEQPAQHESKPARPAEPQPGPTAYSWRRRSECTALLEQGEELHRYGSRFRVLRCGEELVFDDRFWPSVGVSPLAELPCELKDRRELFLWGFGQPTLELRPGFIANIKRFGDDVNFWQYPCRTEGDAFAVHQTLVGPQVIDGSLQIYLGLPWATWIDRKAWPISTLGSFKKRIEDLTIELEKLDIKLTTHTVCQHIFWRDHTHMLKAAGVNEVWLSHKPPREESFDGLKLNPWHLYAVNARESERRKGLSIKGVNDKPILASFIGAHMKHYISDIRLQLKSLQSKDGFHIKIQDEWHFNPIVYGQQVGDPGVIARKGMNVMESDVIEYNQIMSDSVFSICPAGAGPNSLRLWEAMSIGSIPVILSDQLELPSICTDNKHLPCNDWNEVVLFHNEADVANLESRLRSMGSQEIEKRSQLCIQAMRLINSTTCLRTLSSRNIDELPRSSGSVFTHPLARPRAEKATDQKTSEEILQFFKPQQIHNSSSTHSQFTGESECVGLEVPVCQAYAPTIVHFDQCQLVKAIQLNTSRLHQNCLITAHYYNKYNSYKELLSTTLVGPSQKETWHTLCIAPSTWAMGLKIQATPQDTDSLSGEKQSDSITFRIATEADAYAQLAKSLNANGALKGESDKNESRQDWLFLTDSIDNANTLVELHAKFGSGEAKESKALFPDFEPTTTNLIGEPVLDGITMYVHLMNRNENVVKNIDNWLRQKFDELILLDWSSKLETAKLPGIMDDPRVRVIRVEGQTKFIRTIAQNLASRMARFRCIFKCDSDIEIKGDFFGVHPLAKGEFWVGDWHQARDFNERHLHGEVFYHIDDFKKVAGYDERIKSYGQDDTNFKDRLMLSGGIKRVINYNYLHHQEHAQEIRAQGSHGIHPMVATYANRLMTATRPLWSPHEQSSSFRLLSINDKGRYLRFAVDWEPADETNDQLLAKALDIVASWYAPIEEVETMTKDEKHRLVYANQIE